MQLFIARHGETDLNIDERFQGTSDLPLNARGRAQAEALARALPPGIEVIVSSPQQRARQTAQACADALGLAVTPMATFRERDFGALEGLTPAEGEARYPDLWRSGGPWQWAQVPPQAESTAAVVERVDAGLRQLATAQAGRCVLLVAHGFVIRAVRYLFDGLPAERFFDAPRLGNGELLALGPLPATFEPPPGT